MTEIYLCNVCSCHRNIETQRTRVDGGAPKGCPVIQRYPPPNITDITISDLRATDLTGNPMQLRGLLDAPSTGARSRACQSYQRPLPPGCRLLLRSGAGLRVGHGNDAPCPPLTSHGASITWVDCLVAGLRVSRASFSGAAMKPYACTGGVVGHASDVLPQPPAACGLK
eukprot:SAG25_NODE_230_length_11432_cov_34.362481_6_plen_169_part_00